MEKNDDSKTKHTQKAAYLFRLLLVFSITACSPQIAPVLEPEPVPLVSPPMPLGHQEIRQENFQYRPDTVTVIPESESFIITPRASLLPKPESYPFPVVYFRLNESGMTLSDKFSFVEEIKKCGYRGPLKVAGYTDTSGKEKQNMKLSQQRADSVAAVLKSGGFTVVSAKGCGALPGTDLNKNRKAEIIPAK